MPRRQVWFFRFGCWTTIAAAVAHLAFHLLRHIVPSTAHGDIANTPEMTQRVSVLGGSLHSAQDAFDGLSLAVAILLTAVGAIGLSVARRGSHDVLLMSRVARAAAVTSVVLLVIALTSFSIGHALVVGVMATCFLVASVEAPHPEA